MKRSPWMMLSLLLACGQPDEHAEEADETEHTDVRLSPEAVAAARLVVEAAALGALSPDLSLPGRVTLDPRKEALVSAWIGGKVDAISVRTGDTVRRGQVLGTVQSPELGEAISAFRVAEAQDKAADARIERLTRLEAEGVASHSQVLAAEADHAEAEGAFGAAEERLRILGVDATIGGPHAGEHYLSHVPVKSPIAGKVLSTEASVGRLVQPGDMLFHVGDLAEVWLMLDLYERDLSQVAVGQTVRFSVVAWPGDRFEGTVEQVGDWVEPDARTVEVRVVVANPDARLKPNMFATATLSVSRPGDATGIVLPGSAVQSMDRRDVVFVQEGQGVYKARAVVIAERTSAQVLVSDGVSPGDPVVVQGAFTLKSELEKGALGDGHAH